MSPLCVFPYIVAPVSLSQTVADAWEHRLRIAEDPFRANDYLNPLLGRPRLSYRERLDRARINCYGDRVSQMVIVRDNLARLYAWGPRPTPRLPA